MPGKETPQSEGEKAASRADIVTWCKRETAQVENKMCVRGLQKVTSDHHSHKRTKYELDTPLGDGLC